jgi:hypothetical protein
MLRRWRAKEMFIEQCRALVRLESLYHARVMGGGGGFGWTESVELAG